MVQPHRPTDDTRAKVRSLVIAGVAHDDICRVIGVAKATLYKHYRDDLDRALAETNANVASTLVQKALNGDTTAAIFFLKARAGWRDRVALTGDDGGAIKTEEVSPREEIERRIARLAAAGGAGQGS